MSLHSPFLHCHLSQYLKVSFYLCSLVFMPVKIWRIRLLLKKTHYHLTNWRYMEVIIPLRVVFFKFSSWALYSLVCFEGFEAPVSPCLAAVLYFITSDIMTRTSHLQPRVWPQCLWWVIVSGYQVCCDQDTCVIGEAAEGEDEAKKGLTLLKHMTQTSDSFSIAKKIYSHHKPFCFCYSLNPLNIFC